MPQPVTWTEVDDPKASQNFRDLHQSLSSTAMDTALALKLAETQPAAKVFKAATQALTAATPTTLVFDSETLDTAGLHDNVTNNSRLTVPTAGIYAAFGTFDAGGTAGASTLFLAKNGTNFQQITVGLDPFQIPTFTYLVAGDYLELKAQTTNNCNVTATFLAARLSKGS